MPANVADQPETHWYPRRVRAVCVLVLTAGCGSVPNTTPDAPTGVDGSGRPDGTPGPDGACVDTVILAGGSDPVAQGWTVDTGGFFELTYPSNEITQLHTEAGGIESGGTLVLRRDAAVSPGQPFIVDISLLVVQVDPRLDYDTAAGIFGSYSPYPGTVAQRGETVFIDTGAIGWTDGSQVTAIPGVDSFKTYRLAVEASGEANVWIDGQPALNRPSFTTNGTIAVGDWTDRHFVESTIQIRSVTMICPP
jgi:hypothetical protein